MYKQRITNNRIQDLKPDEIFVFGSNLAGAHGGGATLLAIPTMHGGVDKIDPYVKDFICFAKQHPEMTFLVTEIGCGIAGFLPEEIAPLFNEAILVGNIYLPERFWMVLMS